MLFNSIDFLIFFPVVTALHFLLPHPVRWLHLLISSCLFYCAFIPEYIFILFVIIIIDYWAGILIWKSSQGKRKLYLITSLVANLGVLAFFKYFNFFSENVYQLFNLIGFAPSATFYHSVVLPIGLSFHTFQAMSYTIEVYRGNQKPESHFGIYSLYVMFYPQLVAGPIERPQNMIEQFKEVKHFELNRFISGLQQMAWGLFKKVAVADQLAIYVDSIYDNWELNFGLTLIIATYAFAFQIYCDFSGYSDIAQGAARCMGFRLMDNFNLPYFAKSVTEFWRRWHISLSTWLRDYLYIPLGGNRHGSVRTYRNLMITMLLGGLWHGAHWNFVIWGLLHGLYLSLERILAISMLPLRSTTVKIIRSFTVFNLVAVTWVFFRATTFDQAIGIFDNIISGPTFWYLRIQDLGVMASIIFCMSILITAELFIFRKKSVQDIFSARSIPRAVAYLVTITAIITLFGVEGDQFIYFQF